MEFTAGFTLSGGGTFVAPPPPPSIYLWSWGRNGYGNLGLGDTTNRSSPVQGASTDWLRIAAGHYFAMSIKNDGTLWTWGHNSNGQLGLGNTTNNLVQRKLVH